MRCVENGMNPTYGRAHSFGTDPMDPSVTFARSLGSQGDPHRAAGARSWRLVLEAALSEGRPIVLDIVVDPGGPDAGAQ